jgi:hypothetical protein
MSLQDRLLAERPLIIFTMPYPTIIVLSSAYGATEIDVLPSQSIKSVKENLEKIYGGQSLAGMDLVRLIGDEVLVLDDGQKIENLNFAETLSLVPSNTTITVHNSYEDPNEPALEFSVSSRELTLQSIKQKISAQLGEIDQRLICQGRMLTHGVLLLPRHESITIELLDRKFRGDLPLPRPLGSCSSRIISTTETVEERLESELAELRRRDAAMGLPAAHEHLNLESRERVKQQFIQEMMSRLQSRTEDIISKHESEYLQGLVGREVGDILATKTLSSRLEIARHIKRCRDEIARRLHWWFEYESRFWADQIHRTLSESPSSFRLERFPHEIGLVARHAERLAQQQHQQIAEILEGFLAHHFDSPFSDSRTISACNASGSYTFTLEFSPNLVGLIVQIFSTTLPLIDHPAMLSVHVFQDCPFIDSESLREARYAKAQEQCLLEIALSDLRDEL